MDGQEGKYHCTDDLLFILFILSCFAYVAFETVLLFWSDTNLSTGC